jgi:hypothetical protein
MTTNNTNTSNPITTTILVASTYNL